MLPWQKISLNQESGLTDIWLKWDPPTYGDAGFQIWKVVVIQNMRVAMESHYTLGWYCTVVRHCILESHYTLEWYCTMVWYCTLKHWRVTIHWNGTVHWYGTVQWNTGEALYTGTVLYTGMVLYTETLVRHWSLLGYICNILNISILIQCWHSILTFLN